MIEFVTFVTTVCEASCRIIRMEMQMKSNDSLTHDTRTATIEALAQYYAGKFVAVEARRIGRAAGRRSRPAELPPPLAPSTLASTVAELAILVNRLTLLAGK